MRDKLVKKCESLGVEFKYNWKINEIKQNKNKTGWICKSGDHDEAVEVV